MALKVYRTAIGFHDAYVAAASQKAALAAWGSDKNLFARGVAEIVTDDALTAEPLASPGKVIKRLRGSTDEQMAALPPDMPRQATSEKTTASTKTGKSAKPASPKPPPPSRAKLERVEEAVEAFQTSARDQLADLKRREEALAHERKSLLAAHEREQAKLSQQRDSEAASYERAIRRWRSE